MAATYCSVADVEAYLGETLTTSSTPTIAQVTDFIERAEKEIDDLVGTSYTTQTATNELHDFDQWSVFVKEPQLAQVGRFDNWNIPIKNVFKVNNGPIISVTSIYVNQGTTQTPDWKLLTEGTDFIVYKDEATIALIRSDALPVEDWQGIKLTYTYGHATVPLTIEKLCTLMAVKEALRVKQSSSSFQNMDDITIESISISKSTGQSVQLLRDIQSEIDKILDTIVGKINYYIV